MLTPLLLAQNLEHKFATFLCLTTSDKPTQLLLMGQHAVLSAMKLLLDVFLSAKMPFNKSCQFVIEKLFKTIQINLIFLKIG